MTDIKPILDNLRQWLRVARGFSRPSPSPFDAGMEDYIADYTNAMVADQPAHAPSIDELAEILAYIDGLERSE